MARRILDQFSDQSEAAAPAAKEPAPVGTVTRLRPAKGLSMTPNAVRKRAAREAGRVLKEATEKAAKKAARQPPGSPPLAAVQAATQPPPSLPRAASQPQAQPAHGPHSALLEHIFVAVLCAGIGALMIKVAYGSFATIEGTAAYLASAEQAANLAWSIVGSEALLGLFLGLCHKVARFRRLGKALVVMLLLCAVVEACMAWVRTEASVHQAVEHALQPAASQSAAPSGPAVSVSTEGRSRGAIKDMTGLTTAAASLAQTQAAAEARKDAREDRRAAERIASAKDRSRLAQVIPVGAAVVQAGATELGGLAVAELVWSLLAIAASVAAALRRVTR